MFYLCPTDVFQKTKEYYGQLDIVVNNAGILDEVDWVKSININLVCAQ